MNQANEDAWKDAMAGEVLRGEILTAIAGEKSIRLDQLIANGVTQCIDDLIRPITALIESGQVECVLNGSTTIRLRK